MTIIVCGGRDYMDADQVFKSLDRLHAICPIDLVLHGAQTGADTHGENWAKAREINYFGLPAKWKKYGLSAGPRRNAELLTLPGIHFTIAFPGGTGTADMVKKSLAKGVPVLVSPGSLRVKEIQDRCRAITTPLTDTQER